MTWRARLVALGPARLLPAALACCGVLVGLAAPADVHAGPWHDARGVTTLVFALLGPGWAVAGFLVARSLAERLALAAGSGIAIAILLGQLMVTTQLWHPTGLLYLVIAITVPVLVHHARAPESAAGKSTG